MKILITMYSLNNLGGIINNTENLIAGFKELGHEVDMVELVWKDKVSGRQTRNPEKYSAGELYPVHQEGGWLYPDGKRIAYKGKENILRWKKFASKFDMIFWQIPVPTMQKSNRGNMDWLELYELPASVKQITYIHDAHFQKNYPYLYYVSELMVGAGTVNFSAYKSFTLDLPKSVVFSPQQIPDELSYPSYSSRKKGFLSVQIWKRWKHVDDIVRAIPYMDDYDKLMAGIGIEYYYMTSQEKVKPIYIDENGNRIWELAEQHGMNYIGVVAPKLRDRIYRKYRTQIDPSWNVNFAKHGGHHNRTTIEAIINGAIPIARNFGVSDNEEGISDLLIPDENYIMIPYNSTPKEFAEIVNYANNLDDSTANKLQENGIKLLQHFDRVEVAQQFVDIANGKKTGFYNNRVVSKTPQSVIDAADKYINEFFDK